jgi:intracellular septation protein A
MFVLLLIFEICVYPFSLLLPHSPQFIMWKLTIQYGLLGIVLLISGIALKRSLIGLIRPQGLDVLVLIWPRIDMYYAVIFLVLAILNVWFVLFMTAEQWVNFRFFAPYPVLVVYTVVVSLLVSNDIIKHEQNVA